MIFRCFIVQILSFKNVSGLLKRLCLPGQDWFYHLSLLFALSISYLTFCNRAVSTSLSRLMAEHHSVISLLQKLLISDAEVTQFFILSESILFTYKCPYVTEISIIQSQKAGCILKVPKLIYTVNAYSAFHDT